ncbi:MAG: hypothetical protein CL886_00775 [Dehalococcoidia bacterium]|nr:hypothetical protein [Dehalococcoidia bacterium]
MTGNFSSANLEYSEKSIKILKVVSVITVVCVFLLIVLGSVVRVTDSGLGCPDWPLCYGKVLPPLETTAIIEYLHRFVASVIVGPLIIATGALIWISFRKQLWLVVPATISIFLLIIQALLGAVTVLRELPGEIVALHLAVSQLLLATLIMVTVVAFVGPLRRSVENRSNSPFDRLPLLLLCAGIAVYGVIVSGSIVTATGSTAACLTWPFCQGQIFPKEFAEAIHMGHRLVVAVAGLFILYALHLGIRAKDRPKRIRVMSMIATSVFMIQILVGAGIIWSGFPVSVLASHVALATLTWAAVISLAFMAYAEKAKLLIEA